MRECTVAKYFPIFRYKEGRCGEIFPHISLQGRSLWRNISPYLATTKVAVAKYFPIFGHNEGCCGEIFPHISLSVWGNISPREILLLTINGKSMTGKQDETF